MKKYNIAPKYAIEEGLNNVNEFSTKIYKKTHRRLILALIPPTILAYLFDFEGTSPLLLIFAVIYLIGAGYWAFSGNGASELRKIANDVTSTYMDALKIYELCDVKEVRFLEEYRKSPYSENINDPVSKQKVTLMANKYGLNTSESNIINTIKDAEAIEINNELKADKIYERFILKKDKNEIALKDEFINYTGRDKRIAMLKSYIEEINTKEKKVHGEVMNYVNNNMEAKLNWAAMGGIAEGIGGVGAGITTAINTQIDNAKADVHNAKVKDDAILLAYQKIKNISPSLKERSIYESKLQEAKEKYVDMNEDVFKKFAFKGTSFSIDEAGTIRIITTCSLNKQLDLGSRIESVADGIISAEIYEENNRLGVAYLTLPYMGLSYGQEVVLEGMCIGTFKQGVQYKINFVNKNSWAMEK